MITDLTEMIVLSRDKIKRIKEQLKEHILKFIDSSLPAESCGLCGKIMHPGFVNALGISEALAHTPDGKTFCYLWDSYLNDPGLDCYKAHGDDNILERIEYKLCGGCIMKIHNKAMMFSLRLEFPEQFKEYQKFSEYLNPLIDENLKIANSDGQGKLHIQDIMVIYESLNTEFQGQNRFSGFAIPHENSFMKRIIQNFKIKIKRDKTRDFKTSQIRYRLDIVLEQIEIVKQNHRTAIESERFEDARRFLSLFYDLWLVIVDLEERLEKSKHP